MFSNFQKVKGKLFFPLSFYQFKHSLSKEEVVYLRKLVSKELLDWESSLKHECLMTDARCTSLLLSLSSENVFLRWRVFFFDLFVYSG